MDPKVRTAEQVAAELARRSHGVVTRRRLLAAGVTPEEIKRLLRRGALIRVHRGVFRVGHRAPSIAASYLAAVLACGDESVLGGRAAGHLLGLLREAPPAVEVWAPGERVVPGVVVRRQRHGAIEQRTVWRGIPVTTPARTLVDIASSVSLDDLGWAIHRAIAEHRTRPAEILTALALRSNSPGAERLRNLVSGDDQVVLSRLERRFLQLLRAEQLPLPITNRQLEQRYIDCRWPDRRLTVELDSFRYHSSRKSWERDNTRARPAYARGDEFRRFTWGDVFERAEPMLHELRPLLS